MFFQYQDMEIEDLQQEKQRLLSTASSGPATLAVDPAAAPHDAHGKGASIKYVRTEGGRKV